MSDDLRSALTDAFDSADAEAETVEAPVAEAPPAPEPEPVEAAPEAPDTEADAATEKPAGDRGRDEKGRFAKGQKDKAAADKGPSLKETLEAATKPETEAKPAPVPEAAKPEAPKPEPLRAPQSWKPAAREHFASLPADVQAEVIRRERETATAIQEAAPAKKFQAEFQQVVAPYAAMLQAEGTEPMRAVGSLLQTAAALRTAPPGHKAKLVAEIVRTYGIDIAALDEALATGQVSSAASPQGGQYRDPRVDQLLAQLQQSQVQRSQALQQRSAQAIEEFAKSHEFLDDVREDMALLLEDRSRRGVALTMDQAYDLAVRMHPEISGVLQQREAAKAANATSASTQRARAAASSIRSQPASAPKGSNGTNGSVRGSLETAWDEVAGR